MKKILIAEDESILLDVLKNRFRADGWDVITAINGDEAIEAVKKHPFDLVLLDLIMSQKDGFAVLREIRENPTFKTLPIIVLSNLGDQDNIKKALELGANNYYIKTQHSMSEMIEKANQYKSKN